MKLHLVGTGAVGAVERSACSLIDGKILIDCGNGLVKTIMEQGFDIGNIETILITHLHGDHYLDLPYFILSKYFSELDKKTKIYCPKGTEKRVKELADLYAYGDCNFEDAKINGNVEFIEFDKLDNEEVLPGYFVNSYEVQHVIIEPAYGYTIENKGKVVGFSGDTIYCDNVDKIVNLSNVSVLDMCSKISAKSHMDVNDIQNICDKYKDKTIVATHMKKAAREYGKTLNIPNLIIPTDGEEIEI